MDAMRRAKNQLVFDTRQSDSEVPSFADVVE
jgi:hypothetical protein